MNVHVGCLLARHTDCLKSPPCKGCDPDQGLLVRTSECRMFDEEYRALLNQIGSWSVLESGKATQQQKVGLARHMHSV